MVHAPETVIEEQLDKLLGEIEQAMDGDVFSFCGPIEDPFDDYLRNEIENIDRKRKRLLVILETTGGYMEAAERMANTFRHHYRTVEFIVPNYAMSAGTVLVMSGDAIHMDYYSTLGPIDPQIPGARGPIPATGYLQKYEKLVEKSARGQITTAELTYLVQRFDPGELYLIEQALELSISLLREWLVKFKFKNWKTTKTRGVKVTPAMRRKRAEEIAGQLNDIDRWHAHSRGISMHVLRRDLNVEIEDFETAPYGDKIRDYYRLLQDYMIRLGHIGAIHRRTKYVPLLGHLHSH